MTRSWIVDGVGDRLFEQLAAEIPGSELQSLLQRQKSIVHATCWYRRI